MEYDALITNTTKNDDAFAVILETQEGVYIPPGVTRATGIVAGETRRIRVIENSPDRQTNTRWMGIFVFPLDTPPETPADREVLSLFDGDTMFILSTGEVAAALGWESTAARNMLTRLFNEKKLARADIYHKSNTRAVNVLWAKLPGDFL